MEPLILKKHPSSESINFEKTPQQRVHGAINFEKKPPQQRVHGVIDLLRNPKP